ncbi:MAG: hypothetical protein Q8P46_00330 [Hyphomicrobiales bacterium]|nr:hypothetical protein [Hyphomicrobiales bacterium]
MSEIETPMMLLSMLPGGFMIVIGLVWLWQALDVRDWSAVGMAGLLTIIGGAAIVLLPMTEIAA